MTINKIEDNFLTFNVQGVQRQLQEFPRVSETAQKTMKEYDYSGPCPSKELKLYESKVQRLMKDVENSENFKNWSLLLIAIGVALLAVGIFGLMNVSSAIPLTAVDQQFLALGLLGTMFGMATFSAGIIFAEAYRIKSDKEPWKELESLKPKVQQYVTDFVRYYQTYGQKLQSILQKSFDEKENILSEKAEEDISTRENLREALDQIKKANQIAQSFQQYHLTPDAERPGEYVAIYGLHYYATR